MNKSDCNVFANSHCCRFSLVLFKYLSCGHPLLFSFSTAVIHQLRFDRVTVRYKKCGPFRHAKVDVYNHLTVMQPATFRILALAKSLGQMLERKRCFNHVLYHQVDIQTDISTSAVTLLQRTELTLS